MRRLQILLFIAYWSAVVLTVIYSLRGWVEYIPPYWFYAAYYFPPCLVSFLVCLLPYRHTLARLIVALLAFASLCAVLMLQMRMLVAYALRTKDETVASLLDAFYVTAGTGFNNYVFLLAAISLTGLSLCRIGVSKGRA